MSTIAKSLLILMLALMGYSTQAQTFQEGKITFGISYPNLPEEMKAFESMLPKELNVQVKGDKSRSEMKSIAATVVVLSDKAKGGATMLMDMMGKKYAIAMSAEEVKEREEGITYKVKVTNETKEIAGYKCTKALVEQKSAGGKQEFVVYFTKEISAPFGSDKPMFAQIDGFPMEYEMENQGMRMLCTVKAIKAETVADSVFDVPAGYKSMTMAEFEKAVGGK